MTSKWTSIPVPAGMMMAITANEDGILFSACFSQDTSKNTSQVSVQMYMNGSWSDIGQGIGVPSSAVFVFIATAGRQLYLCVDNTVYIYYYTSWIKIGSWSNVTCTGLFIGSDGAPYVQVYDSNLTVYKFSGSPVGTQSWEEIMTMPLGSSNYGPIIGWDFSCLLDGEDNLYAAICDTVNMNGPAWLGEWTSPSSLDFTLVSHGSGNASRTAAAFNGSGVPHLVYMTATSTETLQSVIGKGSTVVSTGITSAGASGVVAAAVNGTVYAGMGNQVAVASDGAWTVIPDLPGVTQIYWMFGGGDTLYVASMAHIAAYPAAS
ncbi:hypothetical protein NAC44_01995 [Allorhizobium sp. BGMRC 0089]|uniref:hypothetical protein n=1 Tax=Allorhizobium sonneratiae TaxID=2934936 RepID=UPI002033B8F3|nr:hypothetical protein [Allorhizobium sonneratiae]MCM2291100.1 hypothetical protein [Allorhizobium sonneratiae]